LGRSRRFDALLFALLALVWAICFGLQLRSGARPIVFPSLGVRSDADGGYPVLIDMAPWSGPAETGLQRGDRLVRLGSSDLRGVGPPLGFYVRFVSEAVYGQPLPRMTYERGGIRAETTIPRPVWESIPLLASLGFVLAALAFFLRAPPSPTVRSFWTASLVTAISFVALISGGASILYAGLAIAFVAWSLVFPLFLRGVAMFPPGLPARGSWARLAPWGFVAVGVFGVSGQAGFPLRKPVGARGEWRTSSSSWSRACF
jgi:hypothetical protein